MYTGKKYVHFPYLANTKVQATHKYPLELL